MAKILQNIKLWRGPVKDPNNATQTNQIRDEMLEEQTCRTTTTNIEQLNIYVDNRNERLKETVEFLELCQKAAEKYALSQHDLAQEYLLKARYREYYENFANSFYLEKKIHSSTSE